MADLLIKGMEMPENCAECLIDAVFCSLWKDIEVIERIKMRHKDCPLVEMPTHGRLIDASLFDVFAYGGDKANNEDFLEGMTYVLEMIDAAPTVIEASEVSEE